MSVAKSLPHDAAILHVTGQARYIDDIPLPAGALHLAFGVSDCAHGRIASIDLAKVRKATGVVAVLTADDLPFANDVSPSPSPEPPPHAPKLPRPDAATGAEGRTAKGPHTETESAPPSILAHNPQH